MSFFRIEVVYCNTLSYIKREKEKKRYRESDKTKKAEKRNTKTIRNA